MTLLEILNSPCIQVSLCGRYRKFTAVIDDDFPWQFFRNLRFGSPKYLWRNPCPQLLDPGTFIVIPRLDRFAVALPKVV
jgi:hypothetical protein